jgi:hypothetical protein
MRVKIDPRGTKYEGLSPLGGQATILDMVCFKVGVPVEGNEMSDGTYIADLEEKGLIGRSRQQIIAQIKSLGIHAEEIQAA